MKEKMINNYTISSTENFQISDINFNKDGLVPVISQSDSTFLQMLTHCPKQKYSKISQMTASKVTDLAK